MSVISAKRRNETSYIHSKVTGIQAEMGSGVSGKEQLKGFWIFAGNSGV